MQTIYLVKKDPNLGSKENWIIMSMTEYAKFYRTPEGKQRHKNIQRIPDDYGCDPIIYAEVDEKTAKEWKNAKNKTDYRRALLKKLGISIESYHAVENEDEEINGEDILEDRQVNTEDEVLRHIETKALIKACKTLKPDELKLISHIYLEGDGMTEIEYAEMIGTSRQYVHQLKKKILKKLKKIMES